MDPHTLGGCPGSKSDIRFALANNIGDASVPGGKRVAEAIGKIPREEVVRMDFDQPDQVLRMRDRQRPQQ